MCNKVMSNMTIICIKVKVIYLIYGKEVRDSKRKDEIACRNLISASFGDQPVLYPDGPV